MPVAAGRPSAPPASELATDSEVTSAIAASTLFHRVFVPEEYDAVGDGTTDDGAAFQAALTAANTAGGGVVRATRGKTYKVRNLRIYSNTTLDLAGATLTYGGSHGTVAPLENITTVIYAEGSSGAYLSRIRITGGKIVGDRSGDDFSATGGDTGGHDAIQLNYVTAPVVEGVNIVDCQQDGVVLSYCPGGVVRDCVFTDCGDAAVELRQGAGFHIANNQVSRCRNLVSSKANVDDVAIIGNSGTTFNSGIIAHGDDWRIIGNKITATTADDQDGADYYGVVVQDGGAGVFTPVDMYRLVVSDNTLTGWASALLLGVIAGYTVYDVTCTGNTVSGGTGIEGPGVGERVTISGNVVTATVGIGIDVRALDARVVGNYVTAATRGINVQSTAVRAVVANNTVDATTGSGIRSQAVGAVIDGNSVHVPAIPGIEITAADCTVNGNRVTATGAGAYGITTSGADTVISNNRVDLASTSGHGIEVGGARSVASGNRVECDTVTGSGIRLGAADCAATGNIVTAGNHGIRVAASTCVVSGNRCSGATFRGVDVQSGTSSLVVGNQLLGNTTAYQDAGTTTTAADNVTS